MDSFMTRVYWNIIDNYLKECVANSHRCAHCVNYDVNKENCVYARICFSHDMNMYDEGED